MHNNVTSVLQNYWGFTALRALQGEIIQQVLEGKDCMALLPTGGGKSLCYQLPALLLEGCCLVVSPLVALMKNQIQDLQQRGIPAEMISAELEDDEVENILTLCKNGEVKLLYVSPERLQNHLFLLHAQEIHFSFLAVDEAHCISEWGQDFRPAYQHIATFKNAFQLSCLAVTGTATPTVVQEIEKKLTLRRPTIFSRSFRRDNIKIIHAETVDKMATLPGLLQQERGSGIIYCTTRKDAETLTSYLQRYFPERIQFYHAGLDSKLKNNLQQWWLASHENILVSTNAFGMGIDKADVRFIIHYNPARTVENYYQEIGRAGRDGQPSSAYLLWSAQELVHFDEVLKNQIPTKQEFLTILSHLYSHYQIAEGDETKTIFPLKMEAVVQTTRCSRAKVAAVFQFLQQQQIIYYQQKVRQSYIQILEQDTDGNSLLRKDAYLLELLVRNLPSCVERQVPFSVQAVADKLQVGKELLLERLRELHAKKIIVFSEGDRGVIKFLQPREERYATGFLWPLFKLVQENKIRKWEEMKYFLTEQKTCKMQLIQRYFGEQNTQPCRNCSICLQDKAYTGESLRSSIEKLLSLQPHTLDQLHLKLYHFDRTSIRDELILLLNDGIVQLLDFKTYHIKK